MIIVSFSKDKRGQWFAWSSQVKGIGAKGKTAEEAYQRFLEILKFYKSLC